MKIEELVKKFKKFFGEKGYTIGNELSLVPQRKYDEVSPFYEFAKTFRPSVGATTFLKELKEGNDPYAVVQRCYRHPDIKFGRIGDGRHLALFRIAGLGTRLKNKEKIMKDFYEFISSLDINKNKIWASYFGGGNIKSKVEITEGPKSFSKDMEPQFFEEDTERKEIFLSLGISEEKIIPLPNKEMPPNWTNFSGLPASDRYGGYRSHLYYEISKPCSRACYPEHNEECKRFIEFAVFIDETIEKVEKNGKWLFIPFYEMGKFPFSVCGLGIERLTMITEGYSSVDQLEIIRSPLKEFLKQIKKSEDSFPLEEIKKITTTISLLQSILFLTSDGAKATTRRNRDRQFIELLKKSLVMISNISELVVNSKEKVTEILLLDIANYFTKEYPYVIKNIDKALNYLFEKRR